MTTFEGGVVIVPFPAAAPQQWYEYAKWLETQPFSVENEDGTVTHYEPKTTKQLVDEGITDYEIISTENRC